VCNHTFDLARCARSDKFKLIYNYTPHGAAKPVDSVGDPGELNNLSGNPIYKDIERDLKRALIEKMVRDWDFLPALLR
jgi:hypothetical protein